MLTEFARAKINLTLDITGVRADGYHELATIMQTLELADELVLTKSSRGIRLSMDATAIDGGENLPCDESNLAWRAAVELQKFCVEKFSGEEFSSNNRDGKSLGVAIELRKRIPAAAGLAGGSSDAAAVLRGMNRLYELNLTAAELCEIGARVGSDVPFCVVGGTCLAEGRGEILTPLTPMQKFREFSVVLAKPRGEISTAWAYRTYDSNPAQTHPPTNEIVSQLARGEFDAAFRNFANVLESVALKKVPAIADCKKNFLAAGAKVALMSGSGPAVFSLTEAAQVERVAASLNATDAQVFVTKIF